MIAIVVLVCCACKNKDVSSTSSTSSTTSVSNKTSSTSSTTSLAIVGGVHQNNGCTSGNCQHHHHHHGQDHDHDHQHPRNPSDQYPKPAPPSNGNMNTGTTISGGPESQKNQQHSSSTSTSSTTSQISSSTTNSQTTAETSAATTESTTTTFTLKEIPVVFQFGTHNEDTADKKDGDPEAGKKEPAQYEYHLQLVALKTTTTSTTTTFSDITETTSPSPIADSSSTTTTTTTTQDKVCLTADYEKLCDNGCAEPHPGKRWGTTWSCNRFMDKDSCNKTLDRHIKRGRLWAETAKWCGPASSTTSTTTTTTTTTQDKNKICLTADGGKLCDNGCAEPHPGNYWFGTTWTCNRFQDKDSCNKTLDGDKKWLRWSAQTAEWCGPASSTTSSTTTASSGELIIYFKLINFALIRPMSMSINVINSIN